MAERRRMTDQKILKAAVIEFGNNGYANTTLSNIAKSSGITAGLIVQNFGSKEELYRRITRYIADYINETFNSYSTTWDIRCVAIVDHFVKILKEKPNAPDYMKFYVSVMTSRDTPDDILKELYDEYAKSPVQKMITEGQSRGEIIEGDPYVIHAMFWLNMIQTIDYCYNNKLEYPSTEWFLQIIRKR